MRIIGILLVIAIIGLVASNYLKSGSKMAGEEELKKDPKEMIDEAQQTVDSLNKNMLQHEKEIEEIKR